MMGGVDYIGSVSVMGVVDCVKRCQGVVDCIERSQCDGWG